MPTLEVQPRPTPEERADGPVKVNVTDPIAELAETVEDWVEHRPEWEFTLHEGHDFGRADNVEGRLLYVSGETTSSLLFRFDQLDGAEDIMDALVLGSRSGRDLLARSLGRNGLEVELFHILTYT